MTMPQFSPGVVSQPANALEQKVNALEQRLDELSRRDLSNAIVGQGGTFRATLEADGINVLYLGPGNPDYGAKQRFTLSDAVGNTVFATDEVAGYGLASPIYNYYMGVMFEGTPSATNTANVEVSTAEANCTFYNPCLYAQCLVNVPASGAFTARYAVTMGGQPTVYSSSSSFSGGSGYVQKMIQIPQAMVAQPAALKLLVTPSATGTCITFPGFCNGLPKDVYDRNATFH